MKNQLWRWWCVTLMGLSSACGAGRSSNLDNSELSKSDAAGLLRQLKSAETTCAPAGGVCAEAAECCSHRCDLRLSKQPSIGLCGDDQVLEGPLSTLPASTKASDFRLDPPVVVGQLASAASDQTTDLEVVFAPDQRLASLERLVLPIDAGKVVLTRASAESAGAAPANGLLFIGNVPVPFAEVLSSQKHLRAVAAGMKQKTVPHFSGRDLTGEDLILPIDDAKRRIPIGIFPRTLDVTRSLMLVDDSVVRDPTRTYDPCTGVGAGLGSWTFGKLMTDMAGPTPPAEFVETWLATFLSDQTAENGQTIRANLRLFGNHASDTFFGKDLAHVIADWPKMPDGHLDLARAPFKLVAIVNRTDLAGNPSYGAVSGAEGRFVFQLVEPGAPGCDRFNFTVIFEFGVPRASCSALRDWAQEWTALSTIPLSSPAFNPALEALTDQFALAGADPSKPNGSALNQLRTDSHTGFFIDEEIWQLREYHLLARGAGQPLLQPSTVAQTPDAQYNGHASAGGTPGVLAPQLGTWVSTHIPSTASPDEPPTYVVPLTFPCGLAPFGIPCSQAFRAGSIDNQLDFWSAPGPANPALNVLSLNTCNGCHGDETLTFFRHLMLDRSGATSSSGFLRGVTVRDPRVPSVTHTYNDLLRRSVALSELASATCSKFSVRPALREVIFPHPLPPLAFRPTLAAH